MSKTGVIGGMDGKCDKLTSGVRWEVAVTLPGPDFRLKGATFTVVCEGDEFKSTPPNSSYLPLHGDKRCIHTHALNTCFTFCSICAVHMYVSQVVRDRVQYRFFFLSKYFYFLLVLVCACIQAGSQCND